jgi:hypothetical protein
MSHIGRKVLPTHGQAFDVVTRYQSGTECLGACQLEEFYESHISNFANNKLSRESEYKVCLLEGCPWC